MRTKQNPRGDFRAGVITSLVAAQTAKGLFVVLVLAALFGRFLACLQRGTENIAQRGTGIGGAILGDRLLLFGDFQRLDRDGNLSGATIEYGDPRIDLLADRKPFRSLIGAIPGEFAPLDEGREIGSGDLDLKAAFLDFEDSRR